MDDPFDNGVEVEDAIGLADAFRQLHEAFKSRELTDLDRQHPSYVGWSNYPHKEPFFGGDAAKEDWLLRCVQSALAEETIKRALQCGELPVYFITKNQMPARFHRREFGRSNWASANTIKGGYYDNANGSNRIGSPYHGACLWVRNSDWAKFSGEANTNSTEPFIAKSERRGRKPGDGSYKVSDAPFLEEMRKLIDSGEATSPNGAATLVVNRDTANAIKGTMPASKITRLAKSYRKSELNRAE